MAAAPLKVYPRIEAALVLAMFRKDRPPLTIDGALWPQDSFTMARLTDASVTDDEALRYRPPVEKTEVSTRPDKQPPAP